MLSPGFTLNSTAMNASLSECLQTIDLFADGEGGHTRIIPHHPAFLHLQAQNCGDLFRVFSTPNNEDWLGISRCREPSAAAELKYFRCKVVGPVAETVQKTELHKSRSFCIAASPFSSLNMLGSIILTSLAVVSGVSAHGGVLSYNLGGTTYNGD